MPTTPMSDQELIEKCKETIESLKPHFHYSYPKYLELSDLLTRFEKMVNILSDTKTTVEYLLKQDCSEYMYNQLGELQNSLESNLPNLPKPQKDE